MVFKVDVSFRFKFKSKYRPVPVIMQSRLNLSVIWVLRLFPKKKNEKIQNKPIYAEFSENRTPRDRKICFGVAVPNQGINTEMLLIKPRKPNGGLTKSTKNSDDASIPQKNLKWNFIIKDLWRLTNSVIQ